MVKPEGIHTGKRIIIGQTDAIAFAQQVSERVLKPILDQELQVWLDDILANSGTETKLLDVLETFLEGCEQFGVKFHSKKGPSFSFETV